MKLVDILARDLTAWPEEVEKIHGWMWEYLSSVKYDEIPWFSEVVDRTQWQAAVDALKADKAPAWVGIGLPPIGIDVEVFADYSHPSFDRFIGQQVHIVAHDVINGDPVAVFRMPVIDGDPQSDQDYHAMVSGSFRPTRTPEQIAAEEQEKGVLQMAHDCGHWWQSETDTKCLPPIFTAMWKAGYRKFEIVDN